MTDIIVYCDDASHPTKRPRVFVSAFTRLATGWLPVDNQRRRTKGAAAVWLRDDTLGGPVEDDGSLHGSENVGERNELDRLKTQLVCRRCRRRLVVRTGKLDALLDQLTDTGREVATLSEIRAILKKSGEA